MENIWHQWVIVDSTHQVTPQGVAVYIELDWMRTLTRALAAIILAGAATCHAQSTVYVWGAGSGTCGEWLEKAKDEWPRAQRTDWILGFLTSYNYYQSSRQVSPPDRASVSAWIDKYCRDNPLHRQFMAAAALLQELGGPKASHEWKR